eukprot:scaffold273379_cov22-Tisochrysis_lutea.AAC.2
MSITAVVHVFTHEHNNGGADASSIAYVPLCALLSAGPHSTLEHSSGGADASTFPMRSGQCALWFCKDSEHTVHRKEP